MTPPQPLRAPSWLDRAIASALLSITPEYRNLRRLQRQNGRPCTPHPAPTLGPPPAMPLEVIPLLG